LVWKRAGLWAVSSAVSTAAHWGISKAAVWAAGTVETMDDEWAVHWVVS
jgi:hypothetical protein